MALKDFRPEIDDLNEDKASKKKAEKAEPQPRGANIDKTDYHKDINAMNIKKLSRRISIIGILLPCVLSAILFFAYMNIKIGDIDKQSERDKTILNFQEQTRAFNVKLEKIQFDTENKLSELNKKAAALEKQVAKLIASKPDIAAIKDQLTKMDTRISGNAAQTKQNLRNIGKAKNDTGNNIKALQKNISAFRQELAKELAKVSRSLDDINTGIDGHKQKLLILTKDLSITDKRLKTMEQSIISKSEMEETISQIKKDMTAGPDGSNTQIQNRIDTIADRIYKLQKDIDSLKKAYKSDMPDIPSPVSSDTARTKNQSQTASPKPATVLKQQTLEE